MQVSGISMSSSTWNPASIGDVHGKPYATALRDVMAAIAEHAAPSELKWRPLYHNLGDEPSEETSLRVLEVAAVFKSSGVSPAPLTSVFTSITSNTSKKVEFVRCFFSNRGLHLIKGDGCLVKGPTPSNHELCHHVDGLTQHLIEDAVGAHHC
jgi:hypothetical protein